MSFRFHIFVWLGLITVVVAGVLTGVVSRQLGQLLVDEGDEELGFAGEATADEVVQVLEANIRVQRAMSRTVSEHLRVRAEARASSGLPSITPATVADLSTEELRAILAERQVSGTTYSVYLGDASGWSLVYDPPTDPGGNLLTSTDYHDRDYFRGARDTGEPFVSRVQTGRRHNVRTVYIGTPIWGEGRSFAGFIGCGLDQSIFQQITDTVAARLPGATVVILDRESVAVAASAGAGLEPGRDLSKVSLLAPTDSATARRAGTDPAGNPVRGSVTTTHELGLGWTVAVYRPRSALDSKIEGARTRALIAAGLVLLGALGVAFVVARRVATPISRLALVATSMGAGRYDDEIPPPSLWLPKEVTALARAIGDTRQKLRAYIVEREARVEELSVSNERLTASIAALGESQEKLLQADRLAAVGRLAGGIAHDFNNILSVILTTAAFMKEDLAGGNPTLSDNAREIIAAAERAAGLTRQLLAFGRRQMLRPVRVDLSAVVADLQKMLLRLIPEPIHLTLSAPGPALVQVDRVQIEQVIVNLVVNARDALPGGGHIRIEVGVAGEREVAEPGLAATGRWLVLSVADDGVGMPEHVRARVFEPFFTTKGPDKGTGLGLATVYGIVKQSGGEVTVTSAPDQGTTFRVFLPMAEAAPTETEASAETAPGPRGATILVVDDEPAIRRIALRVLQKAGYRALDAASGEAALTVAETTSIDVLLTDVIMPGMSGPQLAHRMAAVRPGVEVLFMSGYASESSGVSLDPRHFLPKPFTPSDLLARVTALVEESGRPPTA